MNTNTQRLLALATVSLLISGTVYAAEPQTAGSAKTEPAAASTNVPPHNHMRDAKGVGTGKKHGAAAQNDASAPAATGTSDQTSDTNKPAKPKKSGVKPHSHPRDAKGA